MEGREGREKWRERQHNEVTKDQLKKHLGGHLDGSAEELFGSNQQATPAERGGDQEDPDLYVNFTYSS